MRFELFEYVRCWSQSLFPAVEVERDPPEAEQVDGMVDKDLSRDENMAYWMPLFPPC